MTRKRRNGGWTCLVLAAGLWLCAADALGDRLEQKTTVTRVVGIELGKGGELRPRLGQMLELIRAKRFDEALDAAVALQKDYEQVFDRKLTQRVFASAEERDDYQRHAKAPFEWIDWGYAECLSMQAFVEAERGNFARAIEILDATHKLAPYEVGVDIELAHSLLGAHRPEEALEVYSQALAVTRRFASQAQREAVALRGVGVTLVELGRFDEAEAALRESLKIDPDSPVAKDELDYIRQVRARP